MAAGVFVEAGVAWLPDRADWSFSDALLHYVRHHAQISILIYWGLLGAYHVYRVLDRAHQRELHAAELEGQLAEAKLAELRTQLQPHFLFNTLQTATMLIHDDPDGAEAVLLSFGELLRISFQAHQQHEVTLSEELIFLKHYVAIQEHRFGDRLRVSFEIEDRLNDYAVPSLVLQPIVENAIRHRIGKHKESDTILVKAIPSGQRRLLEVNNQTGALEDSAERLPCTGVGLANTRARLQQMYGNEYSLKIRNLEPRGVEVQIAIPLRKHTRSQREMAGAAPQ